MLFDVFAVIILSFVATNPVLALPTPPGGNGRSTLHVRRDYHPSSNGARFQRRGVLSWLGIFSKETKAGIATEAAKVKGLKNPAVHPGGNADSVAINNYKLNRQVDKGAEAARERAAQDALKDLAKKNKGKLPSPGSEGGKTMEKDVREAADKAEDAYRADAPKRLKAALSEEAGVAGVTSTGISKGKVALVAVAAGFTGIGGTMLVQKMVGGGGDDDAAAGAASGAAGGAEKKCSIPFKGGAETSHIVPDFDVKKKADRDNFLANVKGIKPDKDGRNFVDTNMKYLCNTPLTDAEAAFFNQKDAMPAAKAKAYPPKTKPASGTDAAKNSSNPAAGSDSPKTKNPKPASDAQAAGNSTKAAAGPDAPKPKKAKSASDTEAATDPSKPVAGSDASKPKKAKSASGTEAATDSSKPAAGSDASKPKKANPAPDTKAAANSPKPAAGSDKSKDPKPKTNPGSTSAPVASTPQGTVDGTVAEGISLGFEGDDAVVCQRLPAASKTPTVDVDDEKLKAWSGEVQDRSAYVEVLNTLCSNTLTEEDRAVATESLLAAKERLQ